MVDFGIVVLCGNIMIKKFVIILICIAFISSCSKADNENGASGEPHPHNMLRIALGGEAPTLDPQLREDIITTRVLYDLFGGLLDFNQQNVPIAGMAKSWEITNDGKTYV